MSTHKIGFNPRGDSVEYPQHMLLWRTVGNYLLVSNINHYAIYLLC